jgi:glycosyltransferase involved in cell wall biosynthesis
VKVAFVTQPWDELDASSQYSSIPIVTYQLARRIASKSEVIIYAKRGRSQSKVEQDANGIQIRRVRDDLEEKVVNSIRLAYRLYGFRNPSRPYYGRSWYYLGYFLKVAIDLRKQRCDIVHIHNFSQLVPIVRVFAPKSKIVLHMHCDWLTQLDHKLIEPRIEKSDLIIGCSHFITEKVSREYPKLAGNCRTFHNAVDPNKFSCSRDDEGISTNSVKRLLYVGRLSPEKGLHVLLEAYKRVIKRYPNLELDIVGGIGEAPVEFTVLLSDDDKTADLAAFYTNNGRSGYGSYFAHLQQQLPTDAAATVHFIGAIEQSKLSQYYSKADILVFPSVWNEPFGMPLLEAMACQVPVVATRSGGIPEIIEDGKTGLVVDRDDPHALAEAILTLIENENLRDSMGKAGRQRALQLFTWDKMAEQLMRYYDQLTGGKFLDSQ